MNCPYLILGVSVTASPEEIKTVYRALSKVYHPDAGECANPEQFSRITEAKDLLLDAKRREEYDRTGEVDDSGSKLDQDGRAVALVVQAIHKASESCDTRAWMPVARAAKLSLEHAKEQGMAVHARVSLSVQRLEHTHLTISPKTSLVAKALERRVTEMRKKKKHIEREIACVEEALRLLAEHTFESHSNDPSCNVGMALPWFGNHI